MVKIGIIGGSGLDNPSILQDAQEIIITTPYGPPSSPLTVGKIQNVDVVLLARHGQDHSIMPTHVNNRANIWALKELGCTHLLASSACGSLKEEIKPGDFIFVDQFIDRTTKRASTFYDHNTVCHIPMAEPFCPQLRSLFLQASQTLQLPHHQQGTVITIEGPRFSTKAESALFRSWNADAINMSTVPEVVLAREAGLCYAVVAMSTDYDCWKDSEVTWDEILKVFRNNVEKIIQLFLQIIPTIRDWECRCRKDIGKAMMKPTPEEKIDLKKTIRTVPNWPKPGIMFRDITTLVQNPAAFHQVIQQFAVYYKDRTITKIAGLESRGFIFGAALAYELRLPFILIRKFGKLPAEKITQEYTLEYGTDQLEIHADAILPGDKVLIVDDLLATGGTMMAACQLVEKLQGIVAGTAVVINLPDLKGIDKIKRYNSFYLIEFAGD